MGRNVILVTLNYGNINFGFIIPETTISIKYVKASINRLKIILLTFAIYSISDKIIITLLISTMLS